MSNSPFLQDATSYGISHGTLECRDINATRRFFREVLGLQTLRHSQPSFMTWLGKQPGLFVIACVEAGDQTGVQGQENRWELTVESDEAVLQAHAVMTKEAASWGIQHVSSIGSLDGFPWFCLQDMNGNWWGISSRGSDWVIKVFEAEREGKKL